MAMKLERIVPFGRSMDEYRKMFALADKDLDRTIIGIGDGPASFNAEMSALGKSVVSVDPLYVFSAAEIEEQFYAVLDNITGQVRATPGDWVWSYHRSPEHLRENRVKVLNAFTADYENGKTQGRYVVGELPALDFERNRFNLALCSHFLFLYSNQLSYEFHRAAVVEMLRLAPEVRIFPLLTLTLTVSPYVQPLIDELRAEGVSVSVETMDYALQRGGDKMLRIQGLDNKAGSP